MKDLLEIVSLEMTVKSVRAAVHIQRAGGRELQIVGAASVMLQTPDDVRTKETEQIGI